MNGNQKLKIEGHVLVVCRYANGWVAKILPFGKEPWLTSDRLFTTESDAKLLLFDAVFPAKLLRNGEAVQTTSLKTTP